MATAEEIRELLHTTDYAARARKIAELAAREPVELIACAHCGTGIQRQRRTQRFCSARCRIANFKTTARTASTTTTTQATACIAGSIGYRAKAHRDRQADER